MMRRLALIATLLAALAAAGPLDGIVPFGDDGDERGLTTLPTDPKPLVADLGHPDWQAREKAMRLLIAIGAPARDALREAARSDDAEVRWRAGYILARIDGGFAKPEPDRARLLYAAAAETRQKPGKEADARLLYQSVIRQHPGTRWAKAARERLARLVPARAEAPNPVDATGLVRRLASRDWATRQRASWRLAQLGSRAKAALTEAASSGDTEVAWRARRLLDRIALAERGAASHAEARSASAKLSLLARLFGDEVAPNQPTDLDALVRALASKDTSEAGHAREVLLGLGADALPSLLRGLESADEVAAVEIIDILRQTTGEDLGFDPKPWLAWWRRIRSRGRH